MKDEDAESTSRVSCNVRLKDNIIMSGVSSSSGEEMELMRVLRVV